MSIDQLDDYWHDLFAAALVGTDRRVLRGEPPRPIAELLVEVPPPDVPTSLLDQVAAAAALRRAGTAPLAGVPRLLPPPADPRPALPAVACDRFEQLLSAWPVLEPEWLDAVVANGWQLGPELTVRLLRRHRTDALRPAVVAAAGPLAGWIAEHVPGLQAGRTAASAARPVLSLAGVPPELLAAGAAADEVIAALLARFRQRRPTVADRAPLVAYVAQLPRAVLPAVVAALGDVHGDAATTMLAATLAELAALRDAALGDLERPAVPGAVAATTPADPDPDRRGRP